MSGDFRVGFKVLNGERPSRPLPEMQNDRIWALVEDCWKHHPSDRPAMEAVSTIMIQLLSESGVEEEEGDDEWVVIE